MSTKAVSKSHHRSWSSHQGNMAHRKEGKRRSRPVAVSYGSDRGLTGDGDAGGSDVDDGGALDWLGNEVGDDFGFSEEKRMGESLMDEDGITKHSEDGEKKSKKKSKGSSNGFQSLGLDRPILNGIFRLGYSFPTPIQRRTLPLSLGGKDIVAMARTGSGKTAAFLIPIIQRLGSHSSVTGSRGVILSPTRELAQQSYRFCIGMAKFTSLRICLLQGGDKMEAQFEALSNNPDIIVATPGRLVHLFAEVPDFGLKRVEIFVVDEADRLFEMGFALQINEILERMPQQRQTLLFSATMPGQLVEFARAGLNDPELVRLDTETKLSENLNMAFFAVRSKEKIAALLYLLTEVVDEDDLTVVFVATRHHVDYLKEVLQDAAGINCSVGYGSMDMDMRKINLQNFRVKKNRVLLVTDVAARGLDIPLLNNVINFDFPSNSKLFIHRVGRAARAGRHGTAYSLFTPDELAYVIDLHLFLGRPVRGYDIEDNTCPQGYDLTSMSTENVDIGRFPQNLLDGEAERLDSIVQRSPEISNLEKVISNAHGLYVRTRSQASRRSIKRAKEMASTPSIHPLLRASVSSVERERDLHLEKLHSYRPGMTVFEVDASKNGNSKSEAVVAMLNKRRQDDFIVQNAKKKKINHLSEPVKAKEVNEGYTENGSPNFLSMKGDTKVQTGDTEVSQNGHVSKKRVSKAERARMKKQGISFNSNSAPTALEAKALTEPNASFRDERFFISHGKSEQTIREDAHLSINSRNIDGDFNPASRTSRLEEALLDINPDSHEDIVSKERSYHWDHRKKKYVKASLEEHIKAKRVKNESGALISTSSKKHGQIYQKWQQKTRKKIETLGAVDFGSDEEVSGSAQKWKPNKKSSTDVRRIAKIRHEKNLPNMSAGIGLKNEDKIRKEQKEKEKRREKNARTPAALRKGSAEKSKRQSGGDIAKSKYKPLGKGESLPHRGARSRLIKKGAPKGRQNNRRR